MFIYDDTNDSWSEKKIDVVNSLMGSNYIMYNLDCNWVKDSSFLKLISTYLVYYFIYFENTFVLSITFYLYFITEIKQSIIYKVVNLKTI